MAQSIKHPTLDLSSGLDLRVVSSSPTLGFMLDMEPPKKKRKKKKNGREERKALRSRKPPKWYSG